MLLSQYKSPHYPRLRNKQYPYSSLFHIFITHTISLHLARLRVSWLRSQAEITWSNPLNTTSSICIIYIQTHPPTSLVRSWLIGSNYFELRLYFTRLKRTGWVEAFELSDNLSRTLSRLSLNHFDVWYRIDSVLPCYSVSNSLCEFKWFGVVFLWI